MRRPHSTPRPQATLARKPESKGRRVESSARIPPALASDHLGRNFKSSYLLPRFPASKQRVPCGKCGVVPYPLAPPPQAPLRQKCPCSRRSRPSCPCSRTHCGGSKVPDRRLASRSSASLTLFPGPAQLATCVIVGVRGGAGRLHP